MTRAEEVVVVLIGSGVVQGAWNPVIAALRENELFPDIVTPEGANFAMARLVYIGRSFEVLAEGETSDRSKRSAARAERDRFRKSLRDLKRTIASSLVESEQRSELKTRPEFGDVIERAVLDGADRIGVVTTNWDRTVERDLRQISEDFNVQYLHGRIDKPDELLLPSEGASESYRDEKATRRLMNRRNHLVQELSAASRLVFYGLSVSPLDAELGQVLASGCRPSPGQEARLAHVRIVDPRYPDVAERLATLFRWVGHEIEISGSLPNELGTRWRFSPETLEVERAKLNERTRRVVN